MNENSINYDALINKGILSSKNEISQDKINLISGATTAPLLETVDNLKWNASLLQTMLSAWY
ncbi:MAG: hypothetical protein QHH06_14930 [Clostridiales bacterium]|nr:hypothetical protein [Eubacteriales bacterium]MDH7567731.1 hypothetical protein [Clostridiales bacterium]